MIDRVLLAFCICLGCYICITTDYNLAAWATIVMISVLAYLAEKHWSLVDPEQTELNSLQEIAEKERAKREVQVDQTRDLFDRIKSFKTEVKSVTKSLTPKAKARVRFEMDQFDERINQIRHDTKIDQLIQKSKEINNHKVGGGGDFITCNL